jgi:hypothetical protein
MKTNNTTPPPVSDINAEQLQADMATIRNVLSETEKDREIHRIVIAAGNFFCGLFMLIPVPVMLMVVGFVGISTPETQPGDSSPTAIVGVAAVAVSVIVMLFSLPFLFAGWGVWKKKSWGTVMALIAAALNLLNIPLGTALAIYTIWAASKGKLTQ